MSKVFTAAQPERRDVLVAEVTDWVLQNGVDGFSLRAVARALDTSARMLVYHFKSKELLLAEILQQVAKRWMDGMRFSPHARLSVQLASLWQEHLTTPSAHNLHIVTLQLWATGLASRDPAYRAFVEILSGGWVDVLTEHMSASGIAADLARSRATLCVAAIEGLLLHRLSDPSLPTEQAFGHMVDMVAAWETGAMDGVGG